MEKFGRTSARALPFPCHFLSLSLSCSCPPSRCHANTIPASATLRQVIHRHRATLKATFHWLPDDNYHNLSLGRRLHARPTRAGGARSKRELSHCHRPRPSEAERQSGREKGNGPADSLHLIVRRAKRSSVSFSGACCGIISLVAPSLSDCYQVCVDYCCVLCLDWRGMAWRWPQPGLALPPC